MKMIMLNIRSLPAYYTLCVAIVFLTRRKIRLIPQDGHAQERCAVGGDCGKRGLTEERAWLKS